MRQDVWILLLAWGTLAMVALPWIENKFKAQVCGAIIVTSMICLTVLVVTVP